MMPMNFVFLPFMALMGYACHALSDDYKMLSGLADLTCPADQKVIQKVARSSMSCSLLCSRTPGCEGTIYHHDNGACVGVRNDNPFVDASFPLPGAVFFKLVPGCDEYEYLVNGASPVADSQLSASSYWCDTWDYSVYTDCSAPRYARLSDTGRETGAWIPSTQDAQQWIQVDFSESRVISSIALKGRDPVQDIQYVTSFEVTVSTDCSSSWTTITDAAGSPEVFEGTSGPDVTVERHLAERVVARCVRVHPVTWFNYIALRFDVLGCAL